MDGMLEDLAFIYRYHRYRAQLERRHEPPEAAIEDAAGDTESRDAFSRWIVSDTGDLVLSPRDLLLRIGFSERWVSNVLGPRHARSASARHLRRAFNAHGEPLARAGVGRRHARPRNGGS
jgi:hypothetical protein